MRRSTRLLRALLVGLSVPVVVGLFFFPRPATDRGYRLLKALGRAQYSYFSSMSTYADSFQDLQGCVRSSLGQITPAFVEAHYTFMCYPGGFRIIYLGTDGRPGGLGPAADVECNDAWQPRNLEEFLVSRDLLLALICGGVVGLGVLGRRLEWFFAGCRARFAANGLRAFGWTWTASLFLVHYSDHVPFSPVDLGASHLLTALGYGFLAAIFAAVVTLGGTYRSWEVKDDSPVSLPLNMTFLPQYLVLLSGLALTAHFTYRIQNLINRTGLSG